MNVLVVNTGGVTLDLTNVDDDGRTVAHRQIDPWDGHDTAPIGEFLDHTTTVDAVGHRVVHGGNTLSKPTIINERVEGIIEAAAPLAPLHQQRALLGIRAARTLLPDAVHVACFDTEFHTTIPDPAATYPIPAEWRERWPLRRAGFHGLSHRHVANVVATITGGDARRIVSCHLGSGASLCAIADGRSVDTTMGMTPLEGLMMVNRSGSVDPGLLLWLLQHGGLTPNELADGLYREGGLKGVAGGSGDMRDIIARADTGDAAARLAFDMYIHRLRREIAAMTAALGGIDVLAFTGGVGEHMPAVRAATADGLGYLGLVIDPDRNQRARGDADHQISTPASPARCVVVATGEHIEIAAATRTLLHRDQQHPSTIGVPP